ncbi:MAG: hypothetical protein M1351_02250 [Candidatus Thermoplasmatota archaeon]|nr:hypothetical protein [Candidatus Thermoplasmatota archaeon]
MIGNEFQSEMSAQHFSFPESNVALYEVVPETEPYESSTKEQDRGKIEPLKVKVSPIFFNKSLKYDFSPSESVVPKAPVNQLERCLLEPIYLSAKISFHKLFREIQRSYEILISLQNDFDEDGSPSYSVDVLSKAKNFLLDLWVYAYRKNSRDLPIPDILPGPDGSIDIYWKSDKSKLLMNVKPGNKNEAAYYGKSDNGREIEGSSAVENFSGIIDFLTAG